MRTRHCRICGSSILDEIIRLGKIPLVNYFPLRNELGQSQKKYPLTLCVCRTCKLVQLDEILPGEKIFRNYHYLTSASTPLKKHFSCLAEKCVKHRWVTKNSKVLDIGANDGTLLFEFRRRGAQVLGIDPSVHAVETARKLGINVIDSFFDATRAKSMRGRYGSFRIITATNVLAQTHDVRDFLKGVKILLAPKGVFVAEFAHLLDMVVKNQFDVIYHEHLSYFSLEPLTLLFKECDLQIVDAEKILTQGGSLRIYVRHASTKITKPSKSLQMIRQEEKENYITDLPTLRRFAQQIRQFRKDMRKVIFSIKQNGKRIVGIGAPAKGVVLLGYCGIGKSEIDYIVDSTPLKQGRFFPGTRIPVYAEHKLDSSAQNYLLLLAWNFQESILRNLDPYRRKGAKVIIPFPKLRVI